MKGVTLVGRALRRNYKSYNHNNYTQMSRHPRLHANIFKSIRCAFVSLNKRLFKFDVHGLFWPTVVCIYKINSLDATIPKYFDAVNWLYESNNNKNHCVGVDIVTPLTLMHIKLINWWHTLSIQHKLNFISELLLFSCKQALNKIE